jgi:hypothetical protein
MLGPPNTVSQEAPCRDVCGRQVAPRLIYGCSATRYYFPSSDLRGFVHIGQRYWIVKHEP